MAPARTAIDIVINAHSSGMGIAIGIRHQMALGVDAMTRRIVASNGSEGRSGQKGKRNFAGLAHGDSYAMLPEFDP
jgi:hypothetical protein